MKSFQKIVLPNSRHVSSIKQERVWWRVEDEMWPRFLIFYNIKHKIEVFFIHFELWPPRNLGLAALFLTTRVMWSSRQSLKLSPTTLQSTPQLKPLEFLTTMLATQNISKVPIQTVNHATLSRLAAIIGLDGKALTLIPEYFIKFKWLMKTFMAWHKNFLI